MRRERKKTEGQREMTPCDEQRVKLNDALKGYYSD